MKGLAIAIVATAVALVAGLGTLMALRTVLAPEEHRVVVIAPDDPYEDRSIPEFALVNQDGEPVGEEVFEGRVTITDFMFTHCPLYCPAMTGQMLGLARRLQGTGVRFVSISVDPAHDTPERMREYAGRFGVDFSRWQFLTGDEATVRRIVHDQLGFDTREDPSEPIELQDGSGGTMSNIIHPTRLFLIGPDRRVLGMYAYDSPEEMERLEAKARAVAAALRG